jgi:NTE family protein
VSGCRLVILFVLGVATSAVTSCAHYTRNKPLPATGSEAKYTLKSTRSAQATPDSLLILMSASGGGTRAAALTFGVLSELIATPLPNGGSVADQLDIISSVSGGSFTTAYYALHGAAGLPTFRRQFLDWNAERRLLLSVLYPGLFKLPSKNYSRIDLAERLWTKKVFGNHTYADLIKPATPFVILNGTDFSTGGQFSFTDEYFRTLCSDLLTLPLARAVTTSSAFPGLLNPVSYKSYAGACRDSLPFWASEFFAADGTDDGLELRTTTQGREKARAAAQLASLQRRALRSYIHVLDGGVSDNLGLRPLFRAVTQVDHDESLLPELNSGNVRKVLWVIVNARTARQAASDTRENPPSWKEVLDASASRPMNRLTDESLELLGDRIWNRRREVAQLCNTKRDIPKSMRVQEYVLYVSFDRLREGRERAYFLDLPTTFTLPKADVENLVTFGAKAVRNSEDFKSFLNEPTSPQALCKWALTRWQPAWRSEPDIP